MTILNHQLISSHPLPFPLIDLVTFLIIRKPQILHRFLRHKIMLHATRQIPFRLFSALIIRAARSFDAGQVAFHDVFAFGVVVEWEGAFLRAAECVSTRVGLRLEKWGGV